MRTVGVEEELMLVDAATGAPRAAVESVLRAAEDAGIDGLEHELQQQQVETASAPTADLAALGAELRAWRARAAEAAGRDGFAVAALATSPLDVTPSTTSSERYLWMAERFGLTQAEQLTCGCHVHVSVDSDDEAIGALDRLRVWLPVLTALSANSPSWQGRDTGYASFRSQAWGRWPSAGPIEVLGSAAAYRALVERLLGTGVLLDEGMLYLDARPSARYPTLEIRVADVCLDVDDAVLLAALARGLVETSAARWRDDEPPPDVPAALLRLAGWQAARHGVGGDLLHPADHRPAPAEEVLDALVEHVRPALKAAGDETLVDAGVARVLARGTGADRQRAVLRARGGPAAVVHDAVALTAGAPWTSIT
ncbi:glutamate--cysteine ligase [Angustibacter aerolatus]